ncbi:hypothetical protein [Beijerinckia indica]|uniref:Uncharacterized protein n=1 Tax=Beijerinckia indica subsp. indica (strain ATCC 9039 / DSM 1715 / NCIMB 8712) TaxID=395963 RepID=B2IE67_BEII9|nr:hypothetical protein [Beijerinckia indica]ACB94091.1 hypothetical protein Bind_0438 [Beijerinckia indica subsp. indica ATCC 9039]
MALSAIPVLSPERLEELRVKIVPYLYTTGAPPDHAVQAAKIEQDLGLTRDEIRAIHHHILLLGYVAERARSGFIGLSGKGQRIARQLIDPTIEEPEDDLDD